MAPAIRYPEPKNIFIPVCNPAGGCIVIKNHVMRNRFLCLMGLFTVATVAASAQLRQPFVSTATPTSDSAERKLSILNSLYNKKWYHAGKLIDSVQLGKVYRMPIDNMMCIVPDVTRNARMPVQKARKLPYMPNAYKGPGTNR